MFLRTVELETQWAVGFFFADIVSRYKPAQQGGGGDAEDYLPVGSSSIGDCSLC